MRNSTETLEIVSYFFHCNDFMRQPQEQQALICAQLKQMPQLQRFELFAFEYSDLNAVCDRHDFIEALAKHAPQLKSFIFHVADIENSIEYDSFHSVANSNYKISHIDGIPEPIGTREIESNVETVDAIPEIMDALQPIFISMHALEELSVFLPMDDDDISYMTFEDVKDFELLFQSVFDNLNCIPNIRNLRIFNLDLNKWNLTEFPEMEATIYAFINNCVNLVSLSLRHNYCRSIDELAELLRARNIQKKPLKRFEFHADNTILVEDILKFLDYTGLETLSLTDRYNPNLHYYHSSSDYIKDLNKLGLSLQQHRTLKNLELNTRFFDDSTSLFQSSDPNDGVKPSPELYNQIITQCLIPLSKNHTIVSLSLHYNMRSNLRHIFSENTSLLNFSNSASNHENLLHDLCNKNAIKQDEFKEYFKMVNASHQMMVNPPSLDSFTYLSFFSQLLNCTVPQSLYNQYETYFLLSIFKVLPLAQQLGPYLTTTDFHALSKVSRIVPGTFFDKISHKALEPYVSYRLHCDKFVQRDPQIQRDICAQLEQMPQLKRIEILAYEYSALSEVCNRADIIEALKKHAPELKSFIINVPDLDETLEFDTFHPIADSSYMAIHLDGVPKVPQEKYKFLTRNIELTPHLTSSMESLQGIMRSMNVLEELSIFLPLEDEAECEYDDEYNDAFKQVLTCLLRLPHPQLLKTFSIDIYRWVPGQNLNNILFSFIQKRCTELQSLSIRHKFCDFMDKLGALMRDKCAIGSPLKRLDFNAENVIEFKHILGFLHETGLETLCLTDQYNPNLHKCLDENEYIGALNQVGIAIEQHPTLKHLQLDTRFCDINSDDESNKVHPSEELHQRIINDFLRPLSNNKTIESLSLYYTMNHDLLDIFKDNLSLLSFYNSATNTEPLLDLCQRNKEQEEYSEESRMYLEFR